MFQFKHVLCVLLLLGAQVPSGMSHEIFLMFSAVDENLSWYLDENMKNCCSNNPNLKVSEDFRISNQLHCKLFLSIYA